MRHVLNVFHVHDVAHLNLVNIVGTFHGLIVRVFPSGPFSVIVRASRSMASTTVVTLTVWVVEIEGFSVAAASLPACKDSEKTKAVTKSINFNFMRVFTPYKK